MTNKLDDPQTMARWIRRIKPWGAIPTDGKPWVADVRTYDIPETIVACIRNTAPGCVAISLSRLGGHAMVEAAERAAAERGIRVLWWTGPYDPNEFLGGVPKLEGPLHLALQKRRKRPGWSDNR